VETAIGTLACRTGDAAGEGDAVTLTVRPENIIIAEAPAADGANIVTGRIETVVYLGNMLECAVAVGAARIRVQLHPSTVLQRGAEVRLRLPAEHCLVMRG